MNHKRPDEVRSELLDELVFQVREGSTQQVLGAVKTLNELGWLTNGTLRKVNLVGANLSMIKLKGADLQGANLYRANFYKSNLVGANLHKANLHEANLGRCSMDSADLSYADLSVANLHESKLYRANLRKANLWGAKFVSSNVVDADFTEAVCGVTVFADLNLTSTKGLSTIEHSAPSDVGVNTLIKSQGKIDEVFLRGCGMPESLITYLPSILEKAFDFYSCFISYSHQDKEFAQRLHDRLQREGIRCWLDEHEMLPGDDIYEEIDHGIKFWDKLLLCCSKHSLSSWWVDNEIDMAFSKERELMRERQSQGKKILSLIPLDLDGYVSSEQYSSGKKSQLNSRLVANFRSWKEHDDFEGTVKKLIQALRVQNRKPPAPQSKL